MLMLIMMMVIMMMLIMMRLIMMMLCLCVKITMMMNLGDCFRVSVRTN